jgi:hypothetical protein
MIAHKYILLSCSVDIPLSSGVADRKNSIGWTPSDDFDSLLQRRSSSIGFNRSNSLGLGGMDDPSRRPFVGGGSAAAYEVTRADHYSGLGAQKGRADGHSGSLGMGGGGGIGMSVNPNQHYEMLKLHHMNLLNEIQETTLMMNLYQQQQLQQQQQQLQQQEAGGTGLDSYGRGGGAFARTSLGGLDSIGSNRASLGLGTIPDRSDELMSAKEQQQILEERLQKIKDDIARRKKEAETLEEKSVKRKAKGDEKGEDDDPKSKRIKKEGSDSDDNDDDEADDDDDEADDDDDEADDDDDEKSEEKGTASKGVGV